MLPGQVDLKVQGTTSVYVYFFYKLLHHNFVLRDSDWSITAFYGQIRLNSGLLL